MTHQTIPTTDTTLPYLTLVAIMAEQFQVVYTLTTPLFGIAVGVPSEAYTQPADGRPAPRSYTAGRSTRSGERATG